ncbi:MAG: DUF4300 family protein [Peptoniphilus sp. oral taxon 375]|nr:DUF4300 family protein [Peptoniphilus sp. oral taxon 375]
MKKVIYFLLGTMVLTLVACGGSKNQVLVTNLGSPKTNHCLQDLGEKFDLRDLDQILEASEIINSTNGDRVYPSFVLLDQAPYDPFSFNSDFLKDHPDFQDINCRETLMKVYGHALEVKGADFQGTFLAFDQEDLAKNPTLNKIDPRAYAGLFNEIALGRKVQSPEDRKKAFQESLNAKDFKNHNKAKTIMVYLEDPDQGVYFVGHCGLLMEDGDRYYFFEKRAINEPYSLLSLKSKDQLVHILEGRYGAEDISSLVITEDMEVLAWDQD